jgi:hypothetical protein
MVTVGMMQVTVDQIVDVIAVRNGLVATSGTVHVARLMSHALVLRRAAVGIARRNLEHVLVNVIAVRVMQMPVVKVVRVIAVSNGGMAAVRAMLMRVTCMLRIRARGHEWPPCSASKSRHHTEVWRAPPPERRVAAHAIDGC